jgi:HlyD family secretion protein
LKTRIGWLLVFLLLVGGGAWYSITLRNQPAEVSFTKVMRESITSSVPTNGKVEPIEWAEAHTERAGPVSKILIQRGDKADVGTPLIELDTSEARAELTAAQSRVTQARAELEILEKGGRQVELATISSDLDRSKLELETAQREYDTLVRLESKQAATKFDVTQAKERVDRAKLQIKALEDRRGALVAASERTSAQARLRDAESAVALAEERIKKGIVRAPVSGTIYQFDLKPGAYLNAGDLVATIGRLDRVRVKVFVDEPDLGRVSKGFPVVITWDALPGRSWKGNVDRTPTQIVALGTRNVGEVLCVIENPKNDLLPGTNVNVDIQTESVASALTIPKEAVRRENGETSVLKLSGQTVTLQKVKLGIGSTTRTQVEGLNEGDAVALPSEKPLKTGTVVNPVFP